MKDIERMVISAHLDGEVEAPWDEKVAARIAADEAWATEAQTHQKVRSALAYAPEPDFTEARARVWARLEARQGSDRRVRLFSPAILSVAAAALLVVSAGSGYWWGRSSVSPGPAAASVAVAAVEGTEVAEIQVQVPRQLELKLSGEGQLLMASTLSGTRR